MAWDRCIMDKTLLLRPRLSEKTYALSNNRVYVFDIPKNTNKHSVARAVASQFEVKVMTVNIATISGKLKRTLSLSGKKSRPGRGGRQVDIKKAYVTLDVGHSLPFFAAVDEAETKQEAVQEKVSKALDKKAKQTAKKVIKNSRRGLRIKKQIEDNK